MLAAAVRFLHAYDDFLLIAHVSPDGDTLGSCFALYGALTELGKRAQVVCEEPVPKIYRFLPYAEQLLLPEQVQPHAAVVCVDCADAARTGLCERFLQAAKHSLNIDHHGTNDRYAEVNFVQKAGATGELIYDTLVSLKANIHKDIAGCLYAAITTDTGNFAYSNTTPNTLRIAAELLDIGIDLPYLNRCLFRTVPYHKMRLHAIAVMKSELYACGRIGITMITQADMRSCGATGEDAEGIIDSIRDVDTVEVAVLLRESSDNLVRVSMRGKSSADVSAIATAFGGGGHRLAAGCTLPPPIEEAKARILEAAQRLLYGDDA